MLNKRGRGMCKDRGMWKRIKERKRRKKWKKKIFARTGGRTTATMLRVSDSNHSAMRTFMWGKDVYVDKVDRCDCVLWSISSWYGCG